MLKRFLNTICFVVFRNIKILNALGLAPKVYGKFLNGLAYEYYPGVTLNDDTVKDDKIWPLIAKQMAKMHKVELGTEVKKQDTTIHITIME